MPGSQANEEEASLLDGSDGSIAGQKVPMLHNKTPAEIPEPGAQRASLRLILGAKAGRIIHLIKKRSLLL